MSCFEDRSGRYLEVSFDADQTASGPHPDPGSLLSCPISLLIAGPNITPCSRLGKVSAVVGRPTVVQDIR